MRLKCEFKTDKIPVAYSMMMVSMIKESLKKADDKYYEKIYFYNDNKKNKSSKNITFAVYMKGFTLKDNEFYINDRIIVEISSPDYELLVNIYNGIVSKKVFQYKDEYTITNTGMYMVQEKKVSSNIAIMKTLSPIAVKDKKGTFLKIEDESFIKELHYICNLELENFRGYGLKENLDFEPVSMKKTVVKEEISSCNNMKYEYLYVNAYKGIFKLKGDKEDLNLLYQLGIGFRRNQGFGMVDILE